MKKSLMLVAAALLCGTSMMQAQEIIFGPAVTEITTSPGDSFKLPLNLTNTVKCTTLQWSIAHTDDFVVPFHIEDEGTEDEAVVYEVDFGERLSANYVVRAEYTRKEKNFMVLAMNSTGTKLMPLGEGLFCTMTFDVPSDLPVGEYVLRVIDPVFGWSGGGGAEPEGATVNVKVVASGLLDVNADEALTKGAIYDLQGRRVTNPSSGIYIQDGRKVLVK